MKYRSEIDGLRALAVLPVIFFHAGIDFFKGGYIGVDIFFVISGYLITSIIKDEIAEKRFSFSHFYIRRIKRILPVFNVVILTVFLFGIFILLPEDLLYLSKSILAAIFFYSNIFNCAFVEIYCIILRI